MTTVLKGLRLKRRLISGIMMASDDKEDLLDRVYLYLTEKRYADGTSENCKRIIRKNLKL